MRSPHIAFFILAAALAAAPAPLKAQTVALSVNVFPTDPGAPNSGGTWNMVAKTSGGFTNLGIAAISVYLTNVSQIGLAVEPDLNSVLMSDGKPFNGFFNGALNILYGQDISFGAPHPILTGVGLPAMSDGPDPLGNPAWDGATRIFTGTYLGAVPAFSTATGNVTSANVLVSAQLGTAAVAATVTRIVRVAPEPATLGIAGVVFVALAARRRARPQGRPCFAR